MTARLCKVCGVKPSLAERRICSTCRKRKDIAAGNTSWRRYFDARLASARGRNPIVTITSDNLIEMLIDQGGLCAMSNRKLTRLSGELTKASIDRIDAAKGYTLENVRLVAWAVNRMRNTMSDMEFQSWITALANTPDFGQSVSNITPEEDL